MIKFIKAIIFVLFSSTLCMADSLNRNSLFDRFMNQCGQSSLVKWYSDTIQTPFDEWIQNKSLMGNDLASEQYCELGLEAQEAVGVNSILPVKKFNHLHPFAQLGAAFAESNALYINEEKLKERSYGMQRSALYHEAVHAKYHHKAMDNMLEQGVMIGAPLMLYVGLKRVFTPRAWRKSMAVVGGLALAGFVCNKHRKYQERWADIEGAYATQCSSCVQEWADNRKQIFEQEHHALKDQGYLWSADLEEIASALGDNKCQYHIKN